MTLEQLLSPVVWDWLEENDNNNISEEQQIEEFDKWLIDNESKINESVKNNIDQINESIRESKKHLNLLFESKDFDIDLSELDSLDDIKSDDDDKPISGDVEDEVKTVEDTKIEPEETISGSVILLDPKKAKTDTQNVFLAVDTIYKQMLLRKTNHKDNRKIWRKLDMSNVTDMTALLAFTDIPNADLRDWDVSKVNKMEGLFYKSTFNSSSISSWKPKSCTNFLRMFAYSDFNQSSAVSGWITGEIEVIKYDSDGSPIPDGKGGYEKTKVRVNGPKIGAAEDEESEVLNKFFGDKFDEWDDDDGVKENKNSNNLNKMKHILDFNTFVNEGFGDFVKKGVNKIKSFFKNMTAKFNNFIAMFDDKGEIISATSPYTSLNYISDGEVEGVSAYTGVKNEYINDNVKSVANIVESPEYYGIIDKDSIEYKNYLTMVEMVNEHYSKYGDKLNEDFERVGFSGTSGGLKGVEDINSTTLVDKLNRLIKNAPAYKGKDYSGAMLIWGAPGIGKSTIPNSVIKAWNERNDKKKALMVVECGDLTVDGFSLPMPITKTIGQYLKERPNIGKSYENLEQAIKDIEITVSDEAVKTWVPVYKLSPDKKVNKVRNAIANGFIVTDYEKNDESGEFETVVTETTEGGIILFDEFFRANAQVFKILMQILLNRRFNKDYQLGDKWAIIACSNRPNDDEEVDNGFSSTGAVIGTRFSKQYNFIPNFDEWKKWAVSKGHFDDATITFLMQEKDSNGEYTNWHTIRPTEYSAGKSGWPTPRTWSNLMVELKNIMEDDGYSSIFEIPKDILKEEAAGAIGIEMAEKYIEFLSIYHSAFNPAEVLKNPKYSIPTEIKCSEVIDRLKKYIDLKFDKNNLPTDEQMMNLFNKLEETFKPSKDNYVRPLYVSLMNKFGFLDSKEYRDAMIKAFPNFIKSFMKKYELSSSNIKDFLV